MTLDILAYTLAFAAAVSVAALGIEHLAASNRRPRRSVWALAMPLSVLLPGMLLLRAPAAPVASQFTSVVVESPQPAIATEDSAIPVAGDATTVAASHAPALDVTRTWQLPQVGIRSLLVTWAATSGLLLALLIAMSLLLRRRATAWTRESLLGHDVLVSEDTGPALVGVLQPRIVVPRWFLQESGAVQSLILEHERQHMLARDPLLLRAGILLAMLVPWNLPLWWQLRRMRLAIELDCDARVLGSGADAIGYADVLLGVVRLVATVPMGVVAMTEPASALERRIGNLLSGRQRFARPGLIGAGMLAITGVAVMVVIDAPAIPWLHEDPAATRVVVEEANWLSARGESAQPAAPPQGPGAAGAAGLNEPLAGDAKSTITAPLAAAVVPKVPRLLPPATATIPDAVLRALVQKYPEIIGGAARAGIIEAAIVLKQDGSVYRSALRQPRDSNGSADALAEVMPRDAGAATTALLKPGSAVPGGGTLKSSVALRYLVLPDGYDGKRSEELVQAALLATRSDLLLPNGGDRVNRVTVYMTEDGHIDRLYNELRLRTELRPVPPLEAATWSPIFEPLGVRAEQLGRMGLTYIYAGTGDERTWMIARYAWPRRVGEPIGGFQAAAAAVPRDTFDTAAALAIVQQYLPDTFTRREPDAFLAPPVADPGIPAIALDASGQVILATRVPSQYGASPEAVRVLQQRVPAGVRLTRFVARPIANAEGVGATVLFAWDLLSTPSSIKERL